MRAIRLAIMPLALLGVAAAQTDTPPTVSLKLDKATAAPGAVVKGVLKVTFSEGLHGYQNPPAQDYQIPVKVDAATKGFVLTKATYPTGIDFAMAGETTPSKVYEGTIEIPVLVKVSQTPGTYSLALKLDYQQCNASACFAPSAVTAKAPLRVIAPAKPVTKKTTKPAAKGKKG